MSSSEPTTPARAPDAPPTPEEYIRMQATPEFAELRRRLRAFVFPMTAVFLAWYLLYVLLSTYAVEFMATPVFGAVNLGTLLGLGQFVSTFLITFLYIRHANRKLDPISDQIRHELEGGA